MVISSYSVNIIIYPLKLQSNYVQDKRILNLSEKI